MAIVNKALALQDLPAPPEGKTGWPWTEQSEPLPDKKPDGSEWSRISIVTPSYNQGQFIEETIRSVLLQGYPNLEYIIIDGGSTDNSVEILKKYECWLAYWVSESDRGQSHALNKGFRRATGELIGWQNSDDYYEPAVFANTATLLNKLGDVDIIYGNVNYVNESGKLLFNVQSKEVNLENMLPWPCMYNQSAFFHKKIFADGFSIDESKQHCMDYDLFLRLIIAKYKFHYLPNISANYREHLLAKAFIQTRIAEKEFFEAYKSLYQNISLNSSVREKALSCMVGSCLNDFAKLRLNIFRSRVRELYILCGIRHITKELLVKYFISLLGKEVIVLFKKMKKEMIK